MSLTLRILERWCSNFLITVALYKKVLYTRYLLLSLSFVFRARNASPIPLISPSLPAMHFPATLGLSATFITLASAKSCKQQPVGANPSGNAIGAPSLNQAVPAGKPFEITWTVSISPLQYLAPLSESEPRANCPPAHNSRPRLYQPPPRALYQRQAHSLHRRKHPQHRQILLDPVHLPRARRNPLRHPDHRRRHRAVPVLDAIRPLQPGLRPLKPRTLDPYEETHQDASAHAHRHSNRLISTPDISSEPR